MMVALILEERDEREEEVPDFHAGAEDRDRESFFDGDVRLRRGMSAARLRRQHLFAHRA